MELTNEFGQPAIRKQWDLLLEQDKLPHALLLYGEPGYGILPGALSLAADILCNSPSKGKACGQCPSCNRSSRWIHPDLHVLLPLAGAKSLSREYLDEWRKAITTNPWMNVYQWTQFCGVEGKQVDIHKEDIQNVTSDLCLQSFEGGNKVLIIWMAQFLTKEGNRLLKLIEEPPDQTYFILITNQREQILPTIRSRCMQCYFPPVSTDEISRLLVSFHKTDPAAAERIAQQSGHDMNKALALAQNSMLNFRDELTAWFRALLSRKGNEIAGWSAKMGGQEKEEQKQFVLYAISAIRDIITGNPGGIHSGASSELLHYMNANYDAGSWYPVVEELQNGHEKISRNANTKLLWLALSIQVKNHLAIHRLQHINM